jgi:hypothetical protein
VTSWPAASAWLVRQVPVEILCPLLIRCARRFVSRRRKGLPLSVRTGSARGTAAQLADPALRNAQQHGGIACRKLCGEAPQELGGVSAEAACEISHKALPRKRPGSGSQRYNDPGRGGSSHAASSRTTRSRSVIGLASRSETPQTLISAPSKSYYRLDAHLPVIGV